MDRVTYDIDAQIEESHWWFVGRRRLFADIIAGLQLPPDAAVLDVGSGSGTNLRMLREAGFTAARGLDVSAQAVANCRAKGLVVDRGSIEAVPFTSASFDLALATDVIEHLDDEGPALEELSRVLRPGGHALVTVPAFPGLWGLQDDVSHHRRRYRMGPLLALLGAAGLKPRRAFHFNYLLFGPIWAARQVLKLWRPGIASENQLNTDLLNRILQVVMTIDVRSAPLLRPPFGVSILVLAQRA